MTPLSNQQRPMFPHAIDSSMMATFRSCPQQFFRTYLQHWKPQTESVHLIAGGAFASGLEAARIAFFEQGLSQEDAQATGLLALMKHYGDFECPADSAKSLERMCGALEFYFANYPLGEDGMIPITFPDGRRGIEFSFAEPLPVNHPVTGQPLLFTGRMDMIADFAGGKYVEDDKTTASLGASWSRQWEMRSQFTGYCWAVQQAGIPVAGTIIRGVSILKTKYDTQQAITYRSPMEIDRWLTQTTRDLQRMVKMWEDNWYDFNMDSACGEYGGCSLLQVCKSTEPENWLNSYFEQRVWDPLARKETTVAEFEASWDHKPELINTTAL
jgi:hypothetical protein